MHLNFYVGRFAIQFAFIMAYNERVSERLLDRFNKVVNRLPPIALYNLTRGYRVRAHLGHYNKCRDENTFQSLDEQLKMAIIRRIKSLLDSTTQFEAAFLLQKALILLTINREELLDECGIDSMRIPDPDSILPRVIRRFQYWSDQSQLQELVDFALKHRSHVHMINVSGILRRGFYLNVDFTPEFLEVAASCLNRDLNSMRGLDVLNCSRGTVS